MPNKSIYIEDVIEDNGNLIKPHTCQVYLDGEIYFIIDHLQEVAKQFYKGKNIIIDHIYDGYDYEYLNWYAQGYRSLRDDEIEKYNKAKEKYETQLKKERSQKRAANKAAEEKRKQEALELVKKEFPELIRND